MLRRFGPRKNAYRGVMDTHADPALTAPGARLGLRERKKRATRAALREAALRLSVERGVDAVTVDDIAADVDVSPRTFFNYFSTKEEAVLAEGIERARRVVDALAARPADEPLWEALRAALSRAVGDEEPEREWVTSVRLVRSSPTLASQYLANYATMERLLVAEVVRRSGMDDLDARVIVATAVAALRVAVDHWIDGAQGTTTLAAAIARALDLCTPTAAGR